MKSLNRRQFVIGIVSAAGATTLCSCASTNGPANPPGKVDVGPLSNYALDGIRDDFAKSHGIMLVTFGGRLVATSSLCTHKGCVIDKERDAAGFKCPCHGSRYDRAGIVQEGPARDPLVRYVLWLDSARHVTVDSSKPLIQPLWGRADAYLVART